MEALDPLALLEAEYAAVVAQTKTSADAEDVPEAADAAPAPPDDETRRGDASSSGESDEEEDGGAAYSLLPSSPGGGQADALESETEEEGVEADKHAESEAETPTQPPVRQEMPADKRQTIMQAMQKLQLSAPAWATAGRVSDEQLVSMVERQLRSKE